MRIRTELPTTLRSLATDRSALGFTLVEIMVAILIFGIAVVGLVQAVPRGMQTREKARKLSVATFLAKEQVETLRSLSFNDADLAAGNHVDASNPVAPGFRRTWSIEDDNPMQGMKRVTVRVGYSSAGPDTQAVLVTQLTR